MAPQRRLAPQLLLAWLCAALLLALPAAAGIISSPVIKTDAERLRTAFNAVPEPATFVSSRITDLMAATSSQSMDADAIEFLLTSLVGGMPNEAKYADLTRVAKTMQADLAFAISGAGGISTTAATPTDTSQQTAVPLVATASPTQTSDSASGEGSNHQKSAAATVGAFLARPGLMITSAVMLVVGTWLI
ncbi:hypothetical protein CXG81DRAFT_25196 [Caulochytrium protostelioides]|uniref:Uncharacterized protein n=1 Tax=Caulochytrium protostelioides TaxID=1555241 RepID=A0A4P9X0I4_9FUNG|nr:hypothetical protein CAUPRSCDRAFT_10232 [Caulochytrium protostelioides]RKP02182.1 hypothetical protein CXG81DRAFT_25196 [Caulochytrium protostelioides]|eukprot:RKP02182.1 hypothetical protein CXG81DRAFT_25196 [Caulochytrium protostelioides]